MEHHYETVSMLSMPPEILEYVLSMLPFHRDLPNACLVCRTWYDIGTTLIRRIKVKFLNSLRSGPLIWSHMNSSVITPPTEIISSRYSHAACYHDGAMFVFGGTTTDTTYFNDVLKYNLAQNKWSRITSKNASAPLPKSGATLVAYNCRLVICGGQSRAIQGIHQESRRYHKEIHIFDLKSGVWDQIIDPDTPPRAGHQASIVGDRMVVSGGSDTLHRLCNDIWMLDMISHDWLEVDAGVLRPPKRLYHSQAVLDNKNIIIMGGISERNEPLADVWLLTMCGEEKGFWTLLTIERPENAPLRYFGQATCQVGQKMVTLGKVIRPVKPQKPKPKCAYCLNLLQLLRSQNPTARDSFVIRTSDAHQRNAPLRFRPASRNNRDRMRNEMLDFHLERFRTSASDLRGARPPTLNQRSGNSSTEKCTCSDKEDKDENFQNVHILDLSRSLTEGSVEWQSPIQTIQHRSEVGGMRFYSLVNCADRIAMFGGISQLSYDEASISPVPTSNQLSFLSFQEFS